MRGVADVLAPLLLRTPPRIGSRRPGDLLDQLRTAWGMRGLDVRGTAEATRLFTMSIADVLDEWFESPEVKGVLAINGVIGTWAGPEEPGTAYVMMHHTIGDVGDGQLGSWGYPVGGMGAVTRGDPTGGGIVRRRGADRLTRGPHRRARRPRARSDHRDGRRPAGRGGRRRHAPADHVPAADRPRRAPRRLRPRHRALALPVRGRQGQRRAVRAARLPRLAGHRAARTVHRVGRAVPLDRLPPAGVPGRTRGAGVGPTVLRRCDPVDARPLAVPGRAPT